MDTIIMQMLQKRFFLMFIPKCDVFSKRIYQEKCNIGCSDDIAAYDALLAENKIVVFENRLGDFVFADVHTFDIFQTLQKKHKDVTSYVFCAEDTFGYFKILESGKIVRKIASFGQIDGISSYPEIRGTPCRFELENNKIFQIDWSAKFLMDMLKDFGQKEVLALLDFYIGFREIAEAGIQSTSIYQLKS